MQNWEGELKHQQPMLASCVNMLMLSESEVFVSQCKSECLWMNEYLPYIQPANWKLPSNRWSDRVCGAVPMCLCSVQPLTGPRTLQKLGSFHYIPPVSCLSSYIYGANWKKKNQTRHYMLNEAETFSIDLVNLLSDLLFPLSLFAILPPLEYCLYSVQLLIMYYNKERWCGSCTMCCPVKVINHNTQQHSHIKSKNILCVLTDSLLWYNDLMRATERLNHTRAVFESPVQ